MVNVHKEYWWESKPLSSTPRLGSHDHVQQCWEGKGKGRCSIP
jgi:hypothetical protein